MSGLPASSSYNRKVRGFCPPTDVCRPSSDVSKRAQLLSNQDFARKPFGIKILDVPLPDRSFVLKILEIGGGRGWGNDSANKKHRP